ncbi:MAG: hypothetical protein HZA50_18355 [Planctomycetes bacterium]|nr:hypothetical protein [Planctomycetota bacterium]
MAAIKPLGKVALVIGVFCVFSARPCLAEDPTPMDAPLPPGKITTITCQCTEEIGKKYKALGVPNSGTYHYKVYIPEGYDKETDRKYPVFFFFSPGGNAGMSGLDEQIKRDKWIAIMAVEAKNGPWDAIYGNIAAAYEDAAKRLRIFEGMRFATGFSGGARMSGVTAGILPGVAGIICQGAGMPDNGHGGYIYTDTLKKNKTAICMIVGKQDSNFSEIADMQKQYGGNYPYFYIQTFEGGHEGAPKDLMDNAYKWLVEQTCMNSEPGKIPKSFFLDYVKNKNDQAGQMTSMMDKLDSLISISTLVTKQKLDKDADFKDIFDGAATKIAEIRKDPAFKKESAAKDAYVKAEAYEKDIRKKVAEVKATGNDLKNALNLIINSYKTVARIHKDTAYGQKAADKAAEIEKERG